MMNSNKMADAIKPAVQALKDAGNALVAVAVIACAALILSIVSLMRRPVVPVFAGRF